MQDENEQTDVHSDVQTDDEQVTTIKECKELKNIGRSKKQIDPKVKEFLTYWEEIFKKETGQPYVFSFGKDGKLVKDLLKVHPLEVLKDNAKNFFRDEQCKRRGPTIGIFFQEINRLIGLKAMNPLEEAKRDINRTRMETSVNSEFPGNSKG
jgi:hypothetical protein